VWRRWSSAGVSFGQVRLVRISFGFGVCEKSKRSIMSCEFWSAGVRLGRLQFASTNFSVEEWL
jgi:hypothetical protein